ncbi:MAG TPA: (d)CMP kinase, partial [Gemmatimonadales bacterium]|nr:(d)CMP kinase [Gemmatimonadales bacterium]
ALGFVHLDSGALYRAVTLLALELPEPPDAWRPKALADLARKRGVAMVLGHPPGHGEVTIGGVSAGDRLRSDAVTREVSRVAAMPEVREFVNGILRGLARDGGVVLDGRDIGTAVFPDAEVKVYLVADAAERARRRLLEHGRTPDAGALRAEEDALTRRDDYDSRRGVAPLARADDAVLLDTTRLNVQEQVRGVVDLVRQRFPFLDPTSGRG